MQIVNNRALCTSSRSLAQQDNNSSNKINAPESVDSFRANEEQIEREFEAKHKEQGLSSSSTQPPRNEAEEQRIQEIRDRILNAALAFVNKHSWSREAISLGAEECGYPGVAHGMFPNGGAELVHHFYTKCNRQLIEQLKREVNTRPTDQPAPVPTEFVARAIQLRLEMIVPFVETWPKALAVMTLPQNVPTSLAQLLTLVDDICYYSGDRSVDVSTNCSSIACSIELVL